MFLKELLLFFKGSITGFFFTFLSITPVIYIGNYLFQKGISKALYAALGLTIVQLLWSLIAGYGLYFLIYYTEIKVGTYTLIGAIILFMMAIHAYKNQGDQELSFQGVESKRGVFLEGIYFALMKPMRIIGYAAFYAILSIHREGTTPLTLLPLFLGTGLGVYAWWLGFIGIFHQKQNFFTPRILQKFHKISAGILIAFCCIGLLELYF